MSQRNNQQLLQYHRNRDQKRSASASSNAFTKKQSHFARRNEESAILQQQQTSGLPVDGGGGGGEVNTKFDVFSAAKKNQFHQSPGSVKEHNAVNRILSRSSSSSSFGAGGGEDGGGGRTGRNKKSLYSLDASSGGGALGSGGGHLGQERIFESEGGGRDGETGEPLTGKRARFEEILEKNRDDKAEKKVLKLEQERQTDRLDTEFDSITSLLKVKTRKEEEEEAFYKSGSDIMRAKLADFYEQRNKTRGRTFTLTKGGAGLAVVEDSEKDSKKKDKKQRKNEDAAAAAAAGALGNNNNNKKKKNKKVMGEDEEEAAALEVLERRIQMLRQPKEDAASTAAAALLRQQQQEQEKKNNEEVGGGFADDTPATGKDNNNQNNNNNNQSSSSSSYAASNAAALAADPDASFDSLMGQMLFSRKAYASDKVVTEEDELLGRFQNEIVDLDRMRQQDAANNKLVPDVEDMSRREWLQRGGAPAYRMGQEEDEDENADENENDDDEDEEDIDFDRRGGSGDAFLKRKKQEQKDDQLKKKKQQQDDDDPFSAKNRGVQPKQRKQKQVEEEEDSLNAVEAALCDLESTLEQVQKQQKKNSSSSSSSVVDLRRALSQLHEVCALRPRMAAEAFRLIFLDIHTQHHTKRKPLTAMHLLSLRAATNMFPLTDITKHPVAAPLCSLLPSLLLSGEICLDSPRNIAVSLFLTSTFLDLLRGTASSSSSSSSSFAAVNSSKAAAAAQERLERGGGDNENYGEQKQEHEEEEDSTTAAAFQSLFQQQNRKPFFASEPFIVLCNILSLQLPLSELAPLGKSCKIAAPFSIMPRPVGVGLSYKNKEQQQQEQEENDDESEGENALLSFGDILFDNNGKITHKKLLNTAYEMMRNFISDFLTDSPSAPALLESCLVKFLLPRVSSPFSTSCSSCPASKKQVQALQTLVQATMDKVVATRAPLAMRTFRPRPLRQFEPLLVNDDGDELKERRVMKKELREGKKRLIRGVQATAAVERRAAERTARVEDEHRAGKLKNLMAELQNQQHVMHHVDQVRSKGKSKKKTKISGAPTGDASGGEDGAGGGGGGGDE